MARTRPVAPKAKSAYRSIGEAAAELELQTHVLRYWEGKFPKLIKPVKRRDGRRMFRPADMDALRAVQILVHQRGMTLKGARSLLEEQGIEAVLSGQATITVAAPSNEAVTSPARALQQKITEAYAEQGSRQRLETILHEMNDLKARLDAARMRKAA